MNYNDIQYVLPMELQSGENTIEVTIKNASGVTEESGIIKYQKQIMPWGGKMIQEIYIIDDDESSIMVFKKLFEKDPEYKFISVKSEQIDIALKNIPSIIIVNEDAIEVDIIELCKK